MVTLVDKRSKRGGRLLEERRTKNECSRQQREGGHDHPEGSLPHHQQVLGKQSLHFVRVDSDISNDVCLSLQSEMVERHVRALNRIASNYKGGVVYIYLA